MSSAKSPFIGFVGLLGHSKRKSSIVCSQAGLYKSTMSCRGVIWLSLGRLSARDPASLTGLVLQWRSPAKISHGDLTEPNRVHILICGRVKWRPRAPQISRGLAASLLSEVLVVAPLTHDCPAHSLLARRLSPSPAVCRLCDLLLVSSHHGRLDNQIVAQKPPGPTNRTKQIKTSSLVWLWLGPARSRPSTGQEPVGHGAGPKL